MVETRDLGHATHAARDAAGRGEVVVALGGDGLVGKLAGALRGSAPARASCRRAAATTSPARSGYRRTSAAPRACCSRACARRSTSARRTASPFACIASMGYDSEANRIANEAKLVRGNMVYAYAAIRALLAWKPARFTVRLDGREHRFEGYTVAAANTGYYGGGMNMAPGADPSDGLLDVVMVEQVSKLTVRRQPAQGVQGHPRRRGIGLACTGRARWRSRPTGRSTCTPTETRSRRCPATVRLVRGGLSVIAPRALTSGLRAKVALARAVGALSRASRRGGGTSLPGKLLLRMDDRADRPARAAPRARRDRRQRDQRQDDDLRNGGGDPAGTPACDPVHNRAGANMPGGVATALLEQTGRDRRDSAIGLFEVDEAWLRSVVEDLSPHTVLLGNLFRDQLDRYGELEQACGRVERARGRARRAHLVRAERRRPAGGRPRPRPGRDAARRSRPTSASRTAHMRWSGSSTPPTQSTAGAAAAPTATPPPTSATSACTSARTAATRAPSRPLRRGRSSCAAWRARASRSSSPAGEAGRVAAAAGPLQRLQRDRGRRVLPRGGRDAGAGAARPRVVLGRVRPRGGDRRSGDRRMAILLVKNPAGANEVFRTLAAADGDGELDVWMVLNDRIADGRDISWIWDADFETLAPHAGRVVCSGTRAEELALRLKYAGVGERRLEVVPSLERGFDRRPAREAREHAVRPPHVHRAAAAARRARRPRLRAAVLGMTEAIWHDIECGCYDADFALWEELAGDGPARRCSISDAAPAGSRSGWRAAATASPRSTSSRRSWRKPRGARARGRSSSTPLRPTRVPSTLERRFDLVLAPMQLVQLFHGSQERMEMLNAVAAHLRPGGTVRRPR